MDVKAKCIEAGKTQVQLAEEIGISSQYVNRIIKKKDGGVNKTFVQMIEALPLKVVSEHAFNVDNSTFTCVLLATIFFIKVWITFF